MYIPSIGAAMLIAQLLAPSSGQKTQSGRKRELSLGAARLLGATALGLACAALSARTLVRNLDWLNNDTAFSSALAVCGRSAKLQLQTGKRLLGSGDTTGALVRFALAREIDPDFCDLDFEEAKVRLMLGQAKAALPLLHNSLQCPFTVNGAAPMLMEVYKQLLSQYPNDSWLHGMAASTYNSAGQPAQAAQHHARAAEICTAQGNATCAREHTEGHARAIGLAGIGS
mmetsp:Transcript_46174/g.106573  ORF Transcript_46174/g.106573 Transcript_46174/m.106573 type:complete len:228 (+) Transcript_46174:1757-2440(+)